jgi:hypothetical protein
MKRARGQAIGSTAAASLRPRPQWRRVLRRQVAA